MKQFWRTFVLGACLLGAPWLVHGMATSGIDLTKSTMQINFTPDEKAEVKEITCFGETKSVLNSAVELFTNPKLLKDVLAKFKDDDRKISRRSAETIQIDIQNSNSDTLKQCFKNAGTYKITVKLVDAVGNEAEKAFNFKIMPGDIDAENIDTLINTCTGKYADGSDVCKAGVVLRDSYGNKVYKASNAKVEIPREQQALFRTDDGNLGLSLKNGLMVNNQLLKNSSISAVTGYEGVFSIDLVSWVPTLRNINNVTEEVAKNLKILVKQVPNIANNGDAGTLIPLVETKELEQPILFKRPVLLNINLQPGTLAGGDDTNSDRLDGTFNPLGANEFANNMYDNQRIKISLVPNMDRVNNLMSNFKGGFFNLSDELTYERRTGKIAEDDSTKYDKIELLAKIDRNGTLPSNLSLTGAAGKEVAHSYLDDSGYHVGLSFNKDGIFSKFSNALNPSNYFALGLNNKSVDYIFNFNMPSGSGADGNNKLMPEFDLQSIVEYDVQIGENKKTVRYFAGNSIGQINVAKGVYIEGTVIKRDTTTKFLSNDLQALSGISQTDVRENITRNAFALVRESNNIKESNVDLTTSPDAPFGVDGVLIVKEKNVKIGGKLPSGKKTVVIVDGNLLIADNTYYGNEANDSFGVILINTDTQTVPPSTGNIFVYSTVQNIRGSFFADGGFVNTSTVNLSNLNVDNIDLTSDKQLRLVGALLTMNTVGGAAKNTNDPYLYHPWGMEPKGSSQLISPKYDLLYIRNLNLDMQSCLPLGEYNASSFVSGNCKNDDSSPTGREKSYSFILRFDRKAIEQSPPGFKRIQVINQ
ncbi:hypothetical protein CSB37_00715 [bacterium DOLZORAL124_38_8]|nr:MAG: hypothetical protein CSB37_00715 [bacterium DOLZORAL124_38_8]